MIKMFDTHCHIVFGVDDGAHDLEMSLSMLRLAQEHGIRSMVCSSHSWGMSDEYHRNFRILKNAADEQGIDIELYKGCEIACCEEWLQDVFEGIRGGKLPAMGNSNLYMLEFFPDEISTSIVRMVERLGEMLRVEGIDCGFIIAHVERYYDLHGDAEAVEKLLKMGCLLQINACSLEGEHDEMIKSFARGLVEKKQASLLGSDCHRLFHRPPVVWPGLKYIWDSCDEEYARALCHGNAEKWLANTQL